MVKGNQEKKEREIKGERERNKGRERERGGVKSGGIRRVRATCKQYIRMYVS